MSNSTTQERAKQLIEELVSEGAFDFDRKDTILQRIDQFIADGNAADKFMGCLLKSFLRYEWRFRDPSSDVEDYLRESKPIATEKIKRFVTGDFSVNGALGNSFEK